MIAKSFARIFFRNAINIGLRVIELDIYDRIEEGDEIELNFERGVIMNRTRGEEYRFKPLPEFMQKLLDSGGLITYIKSKKE